MNKFAHVPKPLMLSREEHRQLQAEGYLMTFEEPTSAQRAARHSPSVTMWLATGGVILLEPFDAIEAFECPKL